MSEFDPIRQCTGAVQSGGDDGQPAAQRRDVGYPVCGLGLPRSHLDADAAVTVDGCEPVLVGDVVAREDRRRPTNGGVSRKRSTAVPLSAWVGLISSTIFPCIT